MNSPTFPIISNIVKHRVRNASNPKIVKVVTSLGDSYYLPAPMNPPHNTDQEEEEEIVNNNEWEYSGNYSQNNDIQWIEFCFQDLLCEITDYYLRCDFPINDDENVLSYIYLLGSNDHESWDVLDEFIYNTQNMTIYRTLDAPSIPYSYIRLCCQRMENSSEKIVENFITSIFDFDFNGNLF